jgi:hypothetical protein
MWTARAAYTTQQKPRIRVGRPRFSFGGECGVSVRLKGELLKGELMVVPAPRIRVYPHELGDLTLSFCSAGLKHPCTLNYTHGVPEPR